MTGVSFFVTVTSGVTKASVTIVATNGPRFIVDLKSGPVGSTRLLSSGAQTLFSHRPCKADDVFSCRLLTTPTHSPTFRRYI